MKKKDFVFSLRLFVVLILSFLFLASASQATLFRGIGDNATLTIRSVSYDIPDFNAVHLVRIPTGYTSLLLDGYIVNTSIPAKIYIDGQLYEAPLYDAPYVGNVRPDAKYTIQSLGTEGDANYSVALNDKILNASSIRIEVYIYKGTQAVKKNISLPSSILQEWKTVISADMYADCINGVQETSAVISNFSTIQWGCRGSDYYYSFDLLSEDGTQVLFSALKTGDNLHKFYPRTEIPLLPNGIYMWKVWSYPSLEWGGTGFQGFFYMDRYDSGALPYLSNYNKLQWGSRENGDFFYSVDIFDKDWNMLYEAVANGDSRHSYKPSDLNLSDGQYNWKVWSFPSGSYGGEGFEGSFAVPDPDKIHSLPYKSTYEMIQWESRQKGDSYYCIDILNVNGDMLYRGAKCDVYLHSYSPAILDLDSDTYNWIVWSWPSESYGGDGFQGTFNK